MRLFEQLYADAYKREAQDVVHANEFNGVLGEQNLVRMVRIGRGLADAYSDFCDDLTVAIRKNGMHVRTPLGTVPHKF